MNMKMKKTFNKWVDSLLVESKKKITYIPMHDDVTGDLLKEEEIFFTDQKTLESRAVNEENLLTPYMEEVTPIFDESGNYPVALKTSSQTAYLKVSRKMDKLEPLPIHAGCCPILTAIFVGPPSSGKTVHFLQLTDPMVHDMLARNTNISFQDDLPSTLERRQRYEQARRRFKNDKALPEPNRKDEFIEPYYFYVQNGDRRALLRLIDIDGEQCSSMRWDNKRLLCTSNIFIITVGADELIAGERGEEVQYKRVVSQLLPRLKVLREDNDYEFRVLITKSDLLDWEHPALQSVGENSVEVKDGHLRQTVHDKGFDYGVFNQRSEAIQSYLRSECPNFYNQIVTSIPEVKIEFGAIASIGEECKDGKFFNFQPMWIDELILSILAKEGLYPVSVPDEKRKPNEIEVETVKDTGKKLYAKLKNLMKTREV